MSNIIELAGFVEQTVDLFLNITQSSNDDIMKMLIMQNKQYLETIVEQNKQIIALLEVNNAKN